MITGYKKLGNKPLIIEDMFKLEPAYKDYLWGGSTLKDKYDKKCDFSKVAESWELSANDDGLCKIATGCFSGETFDDFLKNVGKEALGKKYCENEKFPLLIKFIDANKKLSVQIHPDDNYAKRVEDGLGKAEMWYVVDCKENAYIYYGLKEDTTKEEIKRRVEDNTITEILNKVYVKKNDVFFVEPGTIHAIGSGIVVCEIQQNSNSTYRLYDYDRKDSDGNARELHIDKALDVVNTKKNDDTKNSYEAEIHDGYTRQLLADCKYFKTTRYDIKTEADIEVTDESFLALTVVDGRGEIEDESMSIKFNAGDTIFITAGDKNVKVRGNCLILISNM